MSLKFRNSAESPIHLISNPLLQRELRGDLEKWMIHQKNSADDFTDWNKIKTYEVNILYFLFVTIAAFAVF